MKIFVSQPHENRDWRELERESSNLIEWLGELYPGEELKGVPMLDPAQFKGQHPVHYLGMRLQMLCQADLVVFYHDWWTSKECCIERDICEQYGIKYMDMRWAPNSWRRL